MGNCKKYGQFKNEFNPAAILHQQTLSLYPAAIELVIHLGSVIYVVWEHQGAHENLVCQAGNLEYPMSVRSGSRSHNGPRHGLHWRPAHHIAPAPG